MRRIAVMMAAALSIAASAAAADTDTIVLRGQPQTVHLYGARGSGDPVIVSSGDGGWIHLAPQVARILADKGYFVVGFDTKAYLESFTSSRSMLTAAQEPSDYAVLAAYAARGGSKRPVLIGVSEGAGLSLLAATDAKTKSAIGGVIGLGLPDVNELGWRWKDALIYLTHGVPNEPTFSTVSVASRVAPVPLGAIHSTRDEFVPLDEIQRVMHAAAEPRKLWLVEASDHRFSDKLPELGRCLLEAIDWVRAHEVK